MYCCNYPAKVNIKVNEEMHNVFIYVASCEASLSRHITKNVCICAGMFKCRTVNGMHSPALPSLLQTENSSNMVNKVLCKKEEC